MNIIYEYYLIIIVIIVISIVIYNTRYKEHYTDLWDSTAATQSINNFAKDALNNIKNAFLFAFKVELPGKLNCQSNERDDGTSCWIDTYGRGTGRPRDGNCPSGWRNDGITCYEPISCDPVVTNCNPTYWDNCCSRSWGCDWDGCKTKLGPFCIGEWVNCSNDHNCNGCLKGGECTTTGGACRGGKTQPTTYSCNNDEEMNGLLCYPKCRPGYHSVGCCLCEPDGGPRITKNAFDREVCPPPGKPDYRKKIGSLCYYQQS